MAANAGVFQNDAKTEEILWNRFKRAKTPPERKTNSFRILQLIIFRVNAVVTYNLVSVML